MRRPLSSFISTLHIILVYSSCYILKLSAHGGSMESVVRSSLMATPVKESRVFLEEIFQKYGHDGVMTLEGFEHLLRNLGIGGMSLENQLKNNSHSGGLLAVSSESSAVNHAKQFTSAQAASENDDANKPQLLEVENNLIQKLPQERCLSPSEILTAAKHNPYQEISTHTFLQLCPVLIHEVDQGHCDRSILLAQKMTEILPRAVETPNKYVWFYSILAVLVISVTGMLSVAIVPIIRKYFYQKLLQFLVALAIGSLIGDALLHLLPHAMMAAKDPEDHDLSHKPEQSKHGHGQQEVWLGLTALAGIGLFFCAEQLLNFLNVYKEKLKLKKKFRKIQLMENAQLNHVVGEKLSKYSTYTTYGCHREEEPLQELNNTETCVDGDHHNCFQKLSGAEVVDHMADTSADNKCMNGGGDLTSNVTFGGEKINGASKTKNTQDSLSKDKSCEPAIVIDVLSNINSGHHHGHTHVHDIPRTASATAWMVIAGDGLHNFCDGMAIGAAFASSVTGGLSTSIAVFCHELPHELGDFALLLKAGMSTRQALLYNGLSSVLCFVGMLVGLAIGNIHSANSWVFAAAAGMFIYIALVDMMPELNCETGDPPLVKFMIQLLGMSIGATIMCLIALYEHNLQDIIKDGS